MSDMSREESIKRVQSYLNYLETLDANEEELKDIEAFKIVLNLVTNRKAELEEIKAEIEELLEHCDSDYDFEEIYGIKLVVGIIDNHINKADCDNDCEHCEWTECPKE